MEALRLCSFIPSELKSEVIEAEIRLCLPPCCRRERISVRVPMGIEPHPDNLEWHHDGGGKDGTTRHMVVWATAQPTEIRDSHETIIMFQPYDVVWFDNDLAHHRQPRGTDETKRWFVSIRCSGEMI